MGKIKKIEKCNANKASCFCWKTKGHKGLHLCRCGGSWDKKGVPHSFPSGFWPSMPEELHILNPLTEGKK